MSTVTESDVQQGSAVTMERVLIADEPHHADL